MARKTKTGAGSPFSAPHDGRERVMVGIGAFPPQASTKVRLWHSAVPSWTVDTDFLGLKEGCEEVLGSMPMLNEDQPGPEASPMGQFAAETTSFMAAALQAFEQGKKPSPFTARIWCHIFVPKGKLQALRERFQRPTAPSVPA